MKSESPLAIKICGVASVDDAEWALAAGASYVGAMLAPSRRQISFRVAAGMAERCPGRVVAVVRGAQPATWERLWGMPWGGLQVYDQPGAGWIERAQRQGYLAIEPVEEAGHDAADVWLLDGPEPGSGVMRAEELAPRPRHRVWVAGGLAPHNVGAVLSRWRPDGVDVSSGVEREGRKCRALIAEFVQEVRQWERVQERQRR